MGKKLIGSKLANNYNPDGVELAAAALALKEVTGAPRIDMVGYSAGGWAALYAAKLFDKLGTNYKAIAIGTPNLGFNRPNKDRAITIISKGDFKHFLATAYNKRLVDDVRGHSYRRTSTHRYADTGYESSPQTQAIIKEFLNG
jgi:pimeloyl-ACP methyl ester carboxylesterase